MIIKEVKSTEIPYINGFGMQKWNPAYQDYTLDRIEQEAREYEPYGYNFAVFCRSTATIHIYTVTPEYLQSKLEEWVFIFGWENLKETIRMLLEENEAEEQDYWKGI